MLRTSLIDLKELHKKEELAQKFSFKIDIAQKMPRIDHLPFGNLIKQIATTMTNAPKKPIFKLKMEKETFKTLFHLYYTNFKRSYHKVSLDMRILTQNMKKGKEGKKESGEGTNLKVEATNEKKIKENLNKKTKIIEEVREENEEPYE